MLLAVDLQPHNHQAQSEHVDPGRMILFHAGLVVTTSRVSYDGIIDELSPVTA
jgi:hypothetical protein